MSKLRHRCKLSRELERAATTLGYAAGRTATGHLKFTHRATGRIVVAPSTGGGKTELNAYARLRREARA